MDALINLLILYIIFTLFSSLFRKTTSPKKPPKQQKSSTQPQTPVEAIQTKIGQYAQKIEQYLTQATPSEQPPFAATQESVPSSDMVEPSTELILPPTDQELEQLFSLSPEDAAQNILPLSQQQTRVSMAKKTERAESLLNLFANRQSILQGIILSEILGPPLSKRSQK